MELKFWNEASEAEHRSPDDLWISFGDDTPEIISAFRAVSHAANWFKEQDNLLLQFIADRDRTSIRDWADEMRTEMSDDGDWPQDFCDNVADKMDALADLI